MRVAATEQILDRAWTPRQRLYTAVNLLGSAVVAAAAGAGSPLFVFEQGRWHFGDSTLTVMFSVYALTLLLTLLCAGRLSDHLGRRPVLIAALVLLVIASGLFLVADSAGWLIAARAVQGIATGAATSTFTAMISETVPQESRGRMTQIVGALPIGGLALGALGAGAIIQSFSMPVVATFIPLVALITIAIAGAIITPETSARVPGAWRSLAPRVAVPTRLRRDFLKSVGLIAGAWMTSGLFLGLMPKIADQVLGLSPIASAFLIFLQPAVAAFVGIAAPHLPSRIARTIAVAGIVSGGVLTSLGAGTGSVGILILAAISGGVGNGLGFVTALRPLNEAAQTHERGGLMSAVYIVAYLSYGIPTLVAGQVAVTTGVAATVVGYGALIALLGLIALTSHARTLK